MWTCRCIVDLSVAVFLNRSYKELLTELSKVLGSYRHRAAARVAAPLVNLVKLPGRGLNLLAIAPAIIVEGRTVNFSTTPLLREQ